MVFSKQISWIPRSFGLKGELRLAWQRSEKVAYKPGIDYLLECFLPCTFALIIRGKLKHFVTGGGRP